MTRPDDETHLISGSSDTPTLLTPSAQRPVASEPDAATIGLVTPGASGVPSGALPRRVGDYDLESEIARGGMGVVYKARQISLNRPVAFKMILAGQFASAADVDRFHVEAEAAAGLDHPNIVPIYEVGSVQGSHFFSMKLIDGRSMSHEMPRLVKSARDGVRLLVKVCRAIHYAHQHGILHRDLKPANILIDSRGEPHVTDFGLAKRTSEDSQLTQTGTIVGTPSYMAPEQAKPSKVPLTTAADVYSLGAILYEILTGRPPFKGDSPLDTLMLVVNHEAERPRSVNALVDRDLETIAVKCLEKDPERRYGSAEALAEDLERWNNHEPILARPISGVERVVKWARRRPAIAALAAGIALVTVLGIAGVIWQWREAVFQRTQTAAALIQVAQEAQEAEIARDKEAAQRTAAENAKTQETIQRQAADEQRGIAVSALDQLGRVQYLNSVTLADREWSANNIGRVDQLLAASPAPFRNWEWHYLSRLSHMESATLRSSGPSLVAFAVNAEGTHATGVANDLTVSCWDLRTRQVIRSAKLDGNFGIEVAASSLAANGRLFAASIQRIENGRLSTETAVWDTVSGRRLWTLPPVTMTMVGYSAVALNRDGTRLVTASMDLTGAPAASTAATQMQQALTGAGAQSRIRLWNAQTGTEQPSTVSVPGVIANLTLSPDATQVVVTIGKFGETMAFSSIEPLRVVDIATGNVVATLNHSAAGKPVYSPDGHRIALGLPSGLRVWAATGGDELWTWTAKGAGVSAFSGDGKTIAAALADRSIHVVDAATGQDRARFTGSTAPVSAVFFTSSLSEFVSSDGAGVRMFSVRAPASTKLIDGTADTALSNVVSPDSRYLLLHDARGGLRTYDLENGREAYALGAGGQGVPTFVTNPAAARLAFSRDGQRTAESTTSISTMNGAPQSRSGVLIRDVRTGQEVARLTPAAGSFSGLAVATSAALDERGMRVALATMKMQLASVGTRPGEAPSNPASMMTILGSDVVIWRVPAQTPLRTIPFPKAMVVSAELSTDGRLLAVLAGAFGEANRAVATKFEIYDVASGRRLHTFDAGREASPFMFSQSGRFFIGETARSTVTIWDLAHPDRPTVLPEHSGAVTLLALNPDETRCASLSPQGVTVFDVRSGSQLAVLHESEGPFSVRNVMAPGKSAAGATSASLRFSADGRQIIQTTVVPEAQGLRVQFKTWDGSPLPSGSR